VLPLLLLLLSSHSANTGHTAAQREPSLPATVTACRAITRAEVIEALGRTVNDGSETTAGAESSCDYATAHGLVSLVIERVDGMPNLRTEMDSMKKLVPEASFRTAEGIGARAFFVDIPGAGTQLHILGEHECLLVSVLGFGEPAEVASVAEKIARKALARL
jgi:hypothetical protein